MVEGVNRTHSSGNAYTYIQVVFPARKACHSLCARDIGAETVMPASGVASLSACNP